MSLALVADAWSRTYRSVVVMYAGLAGTVETRHGVRVIPDEVRAGWPSGTRVAAFAEQNPVQALDHALSGIDARYGDRSADVVAMQLEYPR